MIDLIKERFEKAIISLDEIYAYDISVRQTNEILSEIKTNIENFAYSETSNLLIFHEILCAFLNIKRNSLFRKFEEEEDDETSKKNVPEYYFKILYKDLIDILEKNLKNKKFPFYNYKEYYFNSNPMVALSSFLIQPDIIGEKNFFSDRKLDVILPNDLILPNKAIDNEIDTKITTINSIKRDIHRIEKFINDILFYNLKIKFDTSDIKSNPETNPFWTKKDFKKEYIDSWINETITANKWKNARFDLWEVVYEYDLDSVVLHRFVDFKVNYLV